MTEWATVEEINNGIVAILDSAMSYTYCSCASELQTDKAAELQSLHDRLAILRDAYQKGQDEFNANAVMRSQLLASSFKNILEMWVAFKRGDASQAWEHLVTAQEDIRVVQRIHADAAVESLMNRFAQIEAITFPKQVFLSAGYTFDRAYCSICDSVYGECNHVRGRIYMGMLCRRVLKEYNVHEASIVDAPENKRCRVETVSSDGQETCTLTLDRIGDKGDAVESGTRIQGAIIHFG